MAEFVFEVDDRGSRMMNVNLRRDPPGVRHIDLRRVSLTEARRMVEISVEEFNALVKELKIVLDGNLIELDDVDRLDAEMRKRRRIAAGNWG